MDVKIPHKKIHGSKVGKTHTLRGGTKDNSESEWWLEKEGKRDGQCLLLYPKGEIRQETYYRNGRLHGPSRFFSLTH